MADDFVSATELPLGLGGEFSAARPERGPFLVGALMGVSTHDLFSVVIPCLQRSDEVIRKQSAPSPMSVRMRVASFESLSEAMART